MSEAKEHSCDARTSWALPLAVAVLFAWFAHCAADIDTKAGRIHTLEAPAPSPTLGTYYENCHGTPTQVTNCYWKNQK